MLSNFIMLAIHGFLRHLEKKAHPLGSVKAAYNRPENLLVIPLGAATNCRRNNTPLSMGFDGSTLP